ncbi:Effector protein NopP [Bradyrhizobium sp. DASA03005]|uniref:Effector protein NopP n=1 Tax=Bradyrhizobium sp. SPXBL-02 TaxID=3395912 RepID=UPI003F709F80
MYNRLDGSPGFPWMGSSDFDEMTQAETGGTQTNQGRSFEDVFSGMQIAPPRSYTGSSSAAARPYSLTAKPPIVEISSTSFQGLLEDYYGDEVGRIAANPQQYSRSVALKAERAADVAYNHGRKAGSGDARHFSYQLGNKSVGLLRTEGGATASDLFEEEEARARWQEQFPGRSDITSTIDFRVTHPLVDNAGDILLEHQLRLDGDEPLVLSHPVNPEAKARAAALGFVEISNSLMVLDPTRHPDKWGKNSHGEWQRENKPRLYLKAEESEGRATQRSEGAQNTAPDWEDDDFM